MRTRFLFLATLLLLTPAPLTAETARFAVLHTADVHASLAAWDDLADLPAHRGLVKVASMVREARGEGVPMLLLDAGDAIEGSPLAAIDHARGATGPDPVTTVMSHMGYDAMAVGNHEFSFGWGALERARRASSFPWLGANVTRGGRRAFDASVVRRLGPVRVGIVGLTTPAVPAMEDSTHWEGLAFGSPVEAARREIERLRGEAGCDVVVVLAHTGLERDPVSGEPRRGETPDENWGYRLATELDGVDLLVLGHTHVVIPGQTLGKTLVVQAGRWAEGLGRVDFELTRAGPRERWTVAERRGRYLAVADSTVEDSAIAAYVRPLHESVRQALDERLGEALAEIGAPRGRFDDGPLWELIQLAQIGGSGADASLASLPDASARIAKGPITLRDVYRIYPYGNTLEVVEMSGAEIDAALEHSALYLAPYTFEPGRPLAVPGMPGHRFDAAEGIGYEIDLTRPEGDRVLHLTFRDQPLDPERRLRVAVNSYRANGGGGFETIRSAPRVLRHGADVREAIAHVIRRLSKLNGSFQRNWRLLPDYAATRERPLLDLLVRQGVAPREEILRLDADEPARRGDLAYWLARAWGWRESRLSGAFADVPDSLEPWIDGLVKRRVLGRHGTEEWIRPFAVVSTGLAVDWCAMAARAGNAMRLDPLEDAAFRRALFTGVLTPHGRRGRGPALPDTLTRSQVLGMIANARFPTLRVLETTDFHGAILPGARERRSGRAFGGSAVLAAWIERLRAENPEGTVLLDGGDCFQGTMISNLQFGRPVVEQMNLLGYAACAVGNHDFDWTADTLVRRARESRYAELGANCKERKTGRIPPPMRADTLLLRRGLRVGVLGLCYRNTPSVTLVTNVAHLRFEDDSITVARLVPGLRRRDRPHVLVGVGHVSAESDSMRRARSGDLRRCAQVPGVDAWFGGHSHNLVADEVNGVPVLIPGSHGQYVAVCDLVVDAVKRRVVERSFRLQPTWADEVEPDSAWRARVERWNADVAPIAAQTVGRSMRAMTRGGPESVVGNLVADVMRARVGADVALQNTGGLRADLPEGTLTKAHIYEVLPFDNTIFVLELTGAELRRALEQGLRRNRVTQVSGIRWSYDPSRPPMERVVSLTLAGGAPVEDAHTYVVACNNFMATGGDDYAALSNGRNRRDTGITLRDALEEFVAARSREAGALDYTTDGRIVRLEGTR